MFFGRTESNASMRDYVRYLDRWFPGRFGFWISLCEVLHDGVKNAKPLSNKRYADVSP
jgi:hypothetical protein